MKRILHVVGGMNIGGTETMLMNIYRNINSENIQYDFISYYTNEGYYDKEIKAMGGRIINLTSPNSIGPLRAIKELCQAIKQFGPYEVVHCHALFNCGISVLAAYLCGIKVRISHAHTTGDIQKSLIRKVYVLLMKNIIRIFSTDLVACSYSAANYLFGSKIIHNKKYSYIPNYIEYEKFLKSNNFSYIKKELNIKEDEVVIGHIGRFIDAKNHNFLIKLIQSIEIKCSKVKVILVGDGILKSEIESKVKQMGLESKTHFLGIREDIPQILSCMDLFIFPSIYEGLGLVLLEAQAAGVACLVSEAIQPEADLGLGLVKRLDLSDDIEIWANTAIKMINNKILDKDMILDGFIKKGYTLKNILIKLSGIYKIKELEKVYEKGINSIL